MFILGCERSSWSLLQKSTFAPQLPILGGEYIQCPLELGDLGGIPEFM
jgi:hypothetical protein